MAKSLAYMMFYAYEAAPDTITKVTLSIGLPEQVREAQWRVTWRIDLNDEMGSERRTAGVNSWQALMIGISMLKFEAKLLFRKEPVSFHYTREGAEQQTKVVSLEDLFPKDR
jgi:hypothetical protein